MNGETETTAPGAKDERIPTYVINLDKHINRNVVRTDMGIEGGSTLS